MASSMELDEAVSEDNCLVSLYLVLLAKHYDIERRRAHSLGLYSSIILPTDNRYYSVLSC